MERVWNYRLVKTEKEVFGRKVRFYNIHEVHYNPEGKPCGMSEEPCNFVYDLEEGEDESQARESIAWSLEHALKAVREAPIFEEPEEWASFMDDEPENPTGVMCECGGEFDRLLEIDVVNESDPNNWSSTLSSKCICPKCLTVKTIEIEE